MIRFLYILIIFSLVSFGQSNFKSERLNEYLIKFIQNDFPKSKVDIYNTINDQNFNESKVTASFDYELKKLGNTNIIISFFKEDLILKSIKIPVSISSFQRVYVLKNDMKSGDKISENDIVSKQLLVNEIINFKDIIGREINRSLKAGSIIKSDYLEEEMAINKGDEIVLQIISGRVLINAKGKAMNDAKIGDIVRIQRSESKTIIEGIATNIGTAQITR